MDVQMQDERGSKRRREDQDEPQRHDILWFPDGNVVLATDKYLFKVYKGLLSMHSSVFKGMFELPNVGGAIGGQNTGGVVQEEYEGVPLITLVGDKGEDVAHLLRALYERRYYKCYDSNTPLDVVVAILVLSVKYDFEDLMRDVVRQISGQFPMSLQSMDLVVGKDENIFGVDQLVCGLRLLEAAFQSGVEALLPILFFFCSNALIEDIFQLSDTMSPGCLHTLIKGRDRLIFKVNELVSDLPELLKFDMEESECLRQRRCPSEARYKCLSGLSKPFFFCVEGEDVVKDHLIHACANCRSSVVKSIEERREEIWAKIPSYFGYPGWEEMQAKLDEIENS
ncbi:hypothetical protein SCHPADRAFT_1002517 [Schizopora paradoxa]|uniref:BTB domain-containing protein n=1 Tax=Schizopora paradoxa TaxID=27342 RepID=A0A0H2RMQ5_9AGAM|nr:hypothetical protein SCHPADRAFT_1002517 [Schizopora paradoxa]